MKSQTDNQMYSLNDLGNGNRWLMASLLAYALLWLGHGTANAQIASSNPLEYVALAEGNELINAQIKAQIEDEQKTALLQKSMSPLPRVTSLSMPRSRRRLRMSRRPHSFRTPSLLSLR